MSQQHVVAARFHRIAPRAQLTPSASTIRQTHAEPLTPVRDSASREVPEAADGVDLPAGDRHLRAALVKAVLAQTSETPVRTFPGLRQNTRAAADSSSSPFSPVPQRHLGGLHYVTSHIPTPTD